MSGINIFSRYSPANRAVSLLTRVSSLPSCATPWPLGAAATKLHGQADMPSPTRLYNPHRRAL